MKCNMAGYYGHICGQNYEISEKENQTMKHVKRLASVLLAMVMVLAMGVTAFATAPEGDGGNTGKVIIKPRLFTAQP